MTCHYSATTVYTVNLIYGKDSESEFIDIKIDVAYGTINSEIAKYDSAT